VFVKGGWRLWHGTMAQWPIQVWLQGSKAITWYNMDAYIIAPGQTTRCRPILLLWTHLFANKAEDRQKDRYIQYIIQQYYG